MELLLSWARPSWVPKHDRTSVSKVQGRRTRGVRTGSKPLEASLRPPKSDSESMMGLDEWIARVPADMHAVTRRDKAGKFVKGREKRRVGGA